LHTPDLNIKSINLQCLKISCHESFGTVAEGLLVFTMLQLTTWYDVLLSVPSFGVKKKTQ
jgi:hypothetical protein